MKKSSVLTDIMPGRTKAMRQKARNNFAIDLSKRCTAEYNAAFKKHSGNVAQIIRGTAFAGGAIVNCYKGDHSRCQKLSYVCKGGQENWVQKSPFLADDFKVKLASSTNPLLRTLINYRLGRQTILKTKLNSNTQKVESVNRRIRRSLPKNVTYARNVFGRCHSAVHSSNYGPGGSLVRLCAALQCPIASGSRVAHQLQSEQRKYELDKLYKQKPSYQNKKCEKRTLLFKLYSIFSEEKNYAKGMLLSNIANKIKAKYGVTYHSNIP